ncbi:MAG: DinB family protein, partial [Chloroflexota bacterium]|nr:DinB family protein [Chloroflexota bacterium]
GKYWRVEPHETTAEILGFYNAEVARARQIVTDADLDTLAHMIEETARHCGHVDLIRESIDGQTGE